MRRFNRFTLLSSAAFALLPALASAQTATNLAALRGLAPFGQLLTTPAGKAALKANYAVTGAIQTGTAHQKLLLTFPAQQQQALADAFITAANAADLADGLGSTLGAAYTAKASYASAKATPTSISPAMATLIGYTIALTESDSSTAKYFYADGTLDGSAMSSPAAYPLLLGGSISVFDRAYPHPQAAGKAACPAKKNPSGDSRPFETLKTLTVYTDPDYFGAQHSNINYLCGPTDNEEKSPAFPSGHTTYGYTESLLLALIVPERYTQLLTRGAEYGNDRIVLGAHYAMDVIAGRTLAEYDLAHLLANDPSYVGQTLLTHGEKPVAVPSVADFPAALAAATADVRAALGPDIATAPDTGRFANTAKNEAFFESTLTYGLPNVYPAHVEDVLKLAPEAGYLLTTAFPGLSLTQADNILTATEAPGGGFLDNGSEFGVYSRLDLFKAALKVEALKASR